MRLRCTFVLLLSASTCCSSRRAQPAKVVDLLAPAETCIDVSGTWMQAKQGSDAGGRGHITYPETTYVVTQTGCNVEVTAENDKDHHLTMQVHEDTVTKNPLNGEIASYLLPITVDTDTWTWNDGRIWKKKETSTETCIDVSGTWMQAKQESDAGGRGHITYPETTYVVTQTGCNVEVTAENDKDHHLTMQVHEDTVTKNPLNGEIASYLLPITVDTDTWTWNDGRIWKKKEASQKAEEKKPEEKNEEEKKTEDKKAEEKKAEETKAEEKKAEEKKAEEKAEKKEEKKPWKKAPVGASKESGALHIAPSVISGLAAAVVHMLLL